MRNALFIFPLIALSTFVTDSLAQEQPKNKSTNKHFTYLAVGSPSLYISVNYEVEVWKINNLSLQPRVGVGFNVFKPSLGNEYNLNTGLSAIYGKNAHKIEVALGMVHILYSQYSYEDEKDRVKYKPVLYSGIGYRFQPQNKRIMFKCMFTPTFTLNADKATFFPYLELGIGYALGKL